ncbi:MAG TPA: two-component sensor histidine kinase, partial [bacterium]|nr:two-component sensor histidine kinase [bacterium]
MVNMPAWLDKIGFRLILAVGVTAILIIGVFSYFNIRSHTEVLLAEVERRANQLSETVKYSTRHDMLFNQRERIHRQIRDIGEQPGINRIRLLNKTGEIVYSSKPDDIGKMVDKNAESCFVCHSDQKPIERLTISERTRIFRLHPDS